MNTESTHTSTLRKGILPLFWAVALLFWEIALHTVVFDGFSLNFAYAIGFSLSIAAALSFLLGLVPAKFNFAANCIVTVLLTILYTSQIVYNAVFGNLYAAAMAQMGGAAISNFWKETALTIWEHLPTLLLFFLPLVALLLLRHFARDAFTPSTKRMRIVLVVAAIGLHLLAFAGLRLGGTDYFSNYYFYRSAETTTNQATERFGLLSAFRLELTGSHTEGDGYFTDEPSASKDDTTEYNVMEIDFDALNALTEDEKIKAINDYCASLSGTNKNEYTGMLKDYNLIVLCAESFATGAIDKELTPTLYKMATEGIVFNNYYNSFPNTTTDGEYALCQGLFPDTSRGKDASSFYASRNSYLPFTLGNVFMEQNGIQSYGYHNFYGNYYGRNKSHPNMGYDMRFAGTDMHFTSSWPASDLEMMEQSIDDYLSQDQFHAYYMTFSGHYKYDRSTNKIASMNYNLVKDLDYSEPVKCYLSCNIELEKAMAYLMQRLEEAGVADRTAIVLCGDHFPYGLTDAQYSELIGYDIDDFSKFKSSLLFWVGGLEEPIVVDEYCCNVDILPTILNLWGFEYDSRMLAGTDVFSDGNHMAVLINKTFLTDKVWFNANTGETVYLVDESELPENYVENMIKLIQTKFSISSDILDTAYYNFVFDQESVKVNRRSWRG